MLEVVVAVSTPEHTLMALHIALMVEVQEVVLVLDNLVKQILVEAVVVVELLSQAVPVVLVLSSLHIQQISRN